jgi:hypothetical protein
LAENLPTYYPCFLLGTSGDPHADPSQRNAVWKRLLLFGFNYCDTLCGPDTRYPNAISADDDGVKITLPEGVWSHIRFTIYAWFAKQLGFQERTRFYECVYSLIDRFFSKSLVGFEDSSSSVVVIV